MNQELPKAVAITATGITVRPGVLRLRIWLFIGRLLGLQPSTPHIKIDVVH